MHIVCLSGPFARTLSAASLLFLTLATSSRADVAGARPTGRPCGYRRRAQHRPGGQLDQLPHGAQAA